MKIILRNKIRDGDCDIYIIHIKINNIESRGMEIISSISDNSWIKELGIIEQTTYKARIAKTIEKIVNEIQDSVNSDKVTSDFGEYLISDSAQRTLEEFAKHKVIPLSELWKEQISGNPGFDFHTECIDSNLLFFGEAKYNASNSPYTIAINQVSDFIDLKKDVMDLGNLKDFTTPESIDNFIKEGKKGYVAAFSINGENLDLIFENVLKTDKINNLTKYPELYLIGIEICE